MIWRWTAVEKLLHGKEPTLGAEVGVKEGRFLHHMLTSFPDLKMFAIDPWEEQPRGNETYSEWDFESIYDQYLDKIGPYSDRVLELREYSNTAVSIVDDFSLDFVFLDAQHDYESVKEDIEIWWPKVKCGGLLCGHDHDDNFPGVVKAVAELVPDAKLTSNAVWYYWVK